MAAFLFTLQVKHGSNLIKVTGSWLESHDEWAEKQTLAVPHSEHSLQSLTSGHVYCTAKIMHSYICWNAEYEGRWLDFRTLLCLPLGWTKGKKIICAKQIWCILIRVHSMSSKKSLNEFTEYTAHTCIAWIVSHSQRVSVIIGVHREEAHSEGAILGVRCVIFKVLQVDT